MSPENKRTIRTALQTVLAIAAAVPLLAAAIAQAEGLSQAAPWLAGAAAEAVAVAAGFARIMALPSVEAFLDRFGIGLTNGGGSTE